MTGLSNSQTEATFIDAPRDPDLQALYNYWNGVRGKRPMPSRQDIDPMAIPKLLPFVFMYNVTAEGGGYTVRIAGEELIRFLGSNPKGHPAGSSMTQRGAMVLVKVLDAVAMERAPKFRAGKAHWRPEREHRDFEGCFLPLSSDGQTVDIIFGGVKFPRDQSMASATAPSLA